jgi:hypothetical protein
MGFGFFGIPLSGSILRHVSICTGSRGKRVLTDFTIASSAKT